MKHLIIPIVSLIAGFAMGVQYEAELMRRARQTTDVVHDLLHNDETRNSLRSRSLITAVFDMNAEMAHGSRPKTVYALASQVAALAVLRAYEHEIHWVKN